MMKDAIYICPNKNCRQYGKGMQNLATICPDYDNYYCFACGTHHAGYNGKLEWYSKQEWEDKVNVVDGIDWRKTKAI